MNINIEHVQKKYGDITVIPDLSVQIKDGEFFTLLGPSGCGKTTLLRMVAGFNSIEGGEIKFEDTVINDMDPGARNIGMVFQNYAIFPNMTVRKNVEFGLKTRKFAPEDIKIETDKFLKLVHVDEYADRMPERLSGGQQQRVALARALVIKPGVLLMDEPLSNLDAKLRVEMRTVIKHIQKDVDITTIYVTHDQEEAMAISDRIAVMKDGVIHQCDRPHAIYLRPSDLFVATFIGKSNLLKGKIKKSDKQEISVQFPSGYSVQISSVGEGCIDGQDVIISCRPEELLISDGEGLKAEIIDSVFLGLNTHYYVRLETGEDAEIVQETDISSILEPGTTIMLRANGKKINIFDSVTGKTLMKGFGK